MPENFEAPKHLGVIPDGNRRWAKQNGLSTREGHQEGYKTLRKIARTAMDMGVEYLSVYLFSTENWQRTEEEVGHLMGIMKWVLNHEIKSIDKENIRVRFAGREDGLRDDIVAGFRAAEEKTANNTRGQLIMCFNYGGRSEIADAVKSIVTQDLSPAQINEKTISEHLYAPGVPDVDLVIRTSGEQRLSNFMLWRASYAEFMFPDVMWPDFDETHLRAAIRDYGQNRARRFGT